MFDQLTLTHSKHTMSVCVCVWTSLQSGFKTTAIFHNAASTWDKNKHLELHLAPGHTRPEASHVNMPLTPSVFDTQRHQSSIQDGCAALCLRAQQSNNHKTQAALGTASTLTSLPWLLLSLAGTTLICWTGMLPFPSNAPAFRQGLPILRPPPPAVPSPGKLLLESPVSVPTASSRSVAVEWDRVAVATRLWR